MFFKKQRRIKELEEEISNLRKNIDNISSNNDFKDTISKKAVADILNLLSIRGILSDLDYYNMLIPYKVESYRASAQEFRQSNNRYIIDIPNIRLNVPEEVYNNYFKTKIKKEE